MEKRKTYKLLLIFHILLFITPLVVKGLHSHEATLCSSLPSGINQGETEDPCYVCHYEFVTFDSIVTANYGVYQPLTSCFDCAIYLNNYKSDFCCFSHRGPPAC